MIIRRPKDDDIIEFKRIAASYDHNPLVSSCETAALVEENGKIAGFGVTRAIIEAVFYSDGNSKERTLALRKLLSQALRDADKLGFNQLYVFVDSEFANILKKHFGFEDAKGECLVFKMDK